MNFKQSDHTLPAIGLALLEKTMDPNTKKHAVCSSTVQFFYSTEVFLNYDIS
jgi:hypothetical protein